MFNIVGIRFKKVGKVFHFDPAGISVKKGDMVIVETSRGIEMGEVVVGVHEIEESLVTQPLRSV